MKPTARNPDKNPRRGGGLLAFGAHPDDIEFGCGGVIASEVAQGTPAHFVICSRGESASSGTPTERTTEAAKAAKLLGATLEFEELGGDAHFEGRPEYALRLAALIRRHRPRIVFSPTTAGSQHPDHVVLGHLVRDAARLARYGGLPELRAEAPHAVDQLLQFAITPEAEPPAVAPLLYDISDPEVMRKWKASMEAHATQLRTRNYVELQLTRARLFGLRAGVEHAMALFPADPLVFSSLAALGVAARRF